MLGLGSYRKLIFTYDIYFFICLISADGGGSEVCRFSSHVGQTECSQCKTSWGAFYTTFNTTCCFKKTLKVFCYPLTWISGSTLVLTSLHN